jgi:hypothetical protein
MPNFCNFDRIRAHGKGADKYDNIRIGINGCLIPAGCHPARSLLFF